MGLYEDQTYEAIMERVLNRVSDSFDKREGSLIFDATGPASAEISLLYIALDYMLTCMYVDTAPRENLILLGRERGILPVDASAAVGIGEFNIDVEIGARFSLEQYNYIVTSKIDTHRYYLTCETLGTAPNATLGALIPIEYIDGLTTAELVEISTPGRDEEDTEVYRERLIESFTYQSFGGNIIDYKTKILDIDGVGAVKIYPTWNENISPASLIPPAEAVDWLAAQKDSIPATIYAWLTTVHAAAAQKLLTVGGAVKAIILDSEFNEPDEDSDLISKVQTIIDPTPNAGEGVGLAPIGHVVTIAGPNTQTINVNFGSIDYQSGWDWDSVKPYAEKIIDDYLRSLKETWQDSENIVVRISRIESLMLNCTGITDIGDATINGSDENVTLESDTIPVRGTVSAEV